LVALQVSETAICNQIFNVLYFLKNLRFFYCIFSIFPVFCF